MTRQLFFVFVAYCILVFCQTSVEAVRKYKTRTRSLGLAIKEVNEIKEKLINSSTTRRLQWEPDFKNEFALKEDDEFVFGVLPEPIKNRAIVKPPSNRIKPKKPGENADELIKGTIRLPREYNTRDIYGDHCPSFNHVSYQGGCGNCWAVAVMSMINDRVCMYNHEEEHQKYYSAQYLTTCLEKGCDGGWFSDALDFWKTHGIAEGGDYRMEQPGGCRAYPKNTNDMKGKRNCSNTCDDGSPIHDENKSFGGARYEIKSRKEIDIMAEIYFYGPVIATFDVYEDLAHYYKSGVYKRSSTTSKKLGGHAAKLYGWGVENGVKFWYAANSWGSTWGDKGFFKIQRGKNEANIESNIHAGLPLAGLSHSAPDVTS